MMKKEYETTGLFRTYEEVRRDNRADMKAEVLEIIDTYTWCVANHPKCGCHWDMSIRSQDYNQMLKEISEL